MTVVSYLSLACSFVRYHIDTILLSFWSAEKQRFGKQGHVFVMTNEMALNDKTALVKQKSAYPP
jgi:hypothetical protein